MEFFTSRVRYSILAGLAAYGTYHLIFDVITAGSILQNCHLHSGGMTNVLCYVFGMA